MLVRLCWAAFWLLGYTASAGARGLCFLSHPMETDGMEKKMETTTLFGGLYAGYDRPLIHSSTSPSKK